MPFDFKKEFKEFNLPKNKPEIVQIPEMKFLTVRGMGDPNVEGGDYQTALGLLYAVAYTLKRSYKTEYQIL
ncbi:MAG: GyrI-like domain-containing protein [Treponema sp.]|nr:GyrI-like domain-containing protein [Treponema sp.]